MIECLVCHRGPQDGVSLYRQNETGVTGIWACIDHDEVNDVEIHDLVQETKDVLHHGKANTRLRIIE